MSKVKVGINGFGRIGRAFFKMAYNNPDIEIVAINDLGSLDNLTYLLTHDTVFGRSPFTVQTQADSFVVEGRTIKFTQERDPNKLPWKDLGVELVLEATGVFSSYEKSKAHLVAGAKRVVISGPVKDDPAAAGVEGATVLMAINDEKLKTCNISSNASCTTNAASPLIGILKESIGIDKAILNTIHAYTATQSIVDGPAKDFRKGRAAAQNIVPTSTGSAIATTQAHTDLENKFDGIAIRVPVPVGSIVDVTFIAGRETSKEEVNQIFTQAATEERWKGLFAVTDEPLVSSDIIGAPFAAIADLSMTRVVGGNLVKVLAWYDNETGYTNTLLQHVLGAAKGLNKE